MEIIKIYVNGFWNGFIDKTDANHIGFFENIFETIFKNFEITNDITSADILFESVFNNTLVDYKKWKFSIFYSGEPYTRNYNYYDLVLDAHTTTSNIVDLPLFVYYIHTNNFLDRLLQPKKIINVPKKFCCFVVSNPHSAPRNKMFDLLNRYKKVDSFGNHYNNMGVRVEFNYWTNEFFDFLSEYKFIICFENTKKGTYITEKIINPLISGIIPIYWGTEHFKNIFNQERILYLEDENSEESYQQLVNKIIELDMNDNKYLEVVNKSVFTNFDYFQNNYQNDSIIKNIFNIISEKNKFLQKLENNNSFN